MPVLTILVLITLGSAAAQTVTATTGAVNGVATDSSQAVTPGVTVVLSGPALLTPLSVVTDQAGAYRFAAVPPGDYTLTFSLDGFSTTARDGIHVALAFTSTVNVEMTPGAVSDLVTVSGASPVVDATSATVTTHFDADKLASLPGARDIFAVLASTPAVAMSRMDVGGNWALGLMEYTAYGLRATTGMNRNEVEGIRVGGANGANDNYLSDYASFAEIAIKSVGQSASMPVPGTLGQYVSKSGGNTYHGALYADFENESWQATNIDAAQIASGVAGGPHLDVHDVNRLQGFRDFTVDAGGYVSKDTLWWYGAYRNSAVGQRYPWLLDTAATIHAQVATGKVTYNLTPRDKLTGYVQRQLLRNQHFNYNPSAVQPLLSSDALADLDNPATVWKGEYSAALTNNLYVEVRIGGYLAPGEARSKSGAPRLVDIGANTVTGGTLNFAIKRNRPQLNGSLSYVKNGWGGTHTVRVGGEYVREHQLAPNDGYLHPCNCQSTFNNGVPIEAQIMLAPNVSTNDLFTTAGFIDDTWRLNERLTVAWGVRLDRYQPRLPAQQGPGGEAFDAVAPVLTFNNWAPRAGATLAVTGDGKTVLKVHYGRYWVYPGVNFTSAFNPNPSGWSQTYAWTSDTNTNGHWDAGEEGRLLAVSGGSASTRVDPAMSNTYVHQSIAYIEREVAPDFGMRTGVVWNARRLPFGTINVSRPLSAYSEPVSVVDPGADARLGSSDDGGSVTAFDLASPFVTVAPVNLTTNLPDSESDYYTWETSATKRYTGRWSLLASFAQTWSREAALGSGAAFTPNSLINSDRGRDHFTTWQAKLQGAINLPFDLRVIPLVRHQSGMPFGRTFAQPLSYGTAVIKAEPFVRRTPNVTLFDLRAEKAFDVARARLMAFVDVYNVFNANAVQALTVNSGGSWLRPTAITGPRILRVGARLNW